MTNFNHDRRTLWWADQQRRMELERGKHRGEPHFLPLTPPQKVFSVSCFIFLFICVSVDLVFLCCFPCLFLIFSLVYVIAFYFWETSETLMTLTTLKTWWPERPGWSWWFQRISIWDLLLSGEMNVITFFFEETDRNLKNSRQRFSTQAKSNLETSQMKLYFRQIGKVLLIFAF